jgi:hypothetical protein
LTACTASSELRAIVPLLGSLFRREFSVRFSDLVTIYAASMQALWVERVEINYFWRKI